MGRFSSLKKIILEKISRACSGYIRKKSLGDLEEPFMTMQPEDEVFAEEILQSILIRQGLGRDTSEEILGSLLTIDDGRSSLSMHIAKGDLDDLVICNGCYGVLPNDEETPEPCPMCGHFDINDWEDVPIEDAYDLR